MRGRDFTHTVGWISAAVIAKLSMTEHPLDSFRSCLEIDMVHRTWLFTVQYAFPFPLFLLRGFTQSPPKSFFSITSDDK